MPAGGGMTGLRVAVLNVAVGLARHALGWMLRQRPRCCGGVEEGSWDPPCNGSRGPAAACTCGEDRSDRYLSFSLPRPESTVCARYYVDGLTFDPWRRAWVGCRVGWGIRELPLPGD